MSTDFMRSDSMLSIRIPSRVSGAAPRAAWLSILLLTGP
jgi:hypothetical protein